MTRSTTHEKEHIQLLLRIAFNPSASGEGLSAVRQMGSSEREDFLRLAHSHHFVIRSIRALHSANIPPSEASEQGDELRGWLESSLAREELRVMNALHFLSHICAELEAAGCPTVVIKSLDHWPDIGNDLDLYTTGDEQRVKQVMRGKFRARQERPSWGDRLAHKLNFSVSGLRELVEVHVGRLGQTGEYTEMARRFVSRRVSVSLGGRALFVPAPEERVIAATLQRMYRHFYARVCDLVNTAQLIQSGVLNYDELRATSEEAGIWPGVATFLCIVSDYAFRYGGEVLNLPSLVVDAARFDGSALEPKKSFLRVPIWPQGAELYASQLGRCVFGGEAAKAFRLSLLPGLASAAVIAERVTGSDKGIW